MGEEAVVSGVTLGAVDGATVPALKRFDLALAVDLHSLSQEESICRQCVIVSLTITFFVSPAKSGKPWVIGWSCYWPTDCSSSD
jgi:hypothetical protein